MLWVRGAAAGALAALVAWPALTGVASALGRDREGPGPLPWRSGGVLPFTVDAATFPDSAGYALEVYVRLPPATLGGAAVDSTGASALAVSVRLRVAGLPVQEREQVLTAFPGDSAGGFGKVMALRFRTRPGSQRLRVRLEDLNSRKRGLVYVGRLIRNAAEVEGEFAAPKTQMGRDLSDIEFVWDQFRGARPGAFQHDTVTDLPDPERLYGLFAPDLRAFFVARSPAEREWRWVARVFDPEGKVLLERDSTSTASRWLRTSARVDLTTLPAGGYDFEIKAWQEGDAGALARRGHFSVAWQTESWTMNPVELEDELHLLLTGGDEETFDRLEPGERERFVDQYWKARDPSPGTAENEALGEFRRRIQYANVTYSRPGLQKGMFTDMGRTYIRYGQPDEVLHQVMPAGDETLDQVLDDIARTESRPATDVRQPGPGGDIRPFEVWIYEGVIPAPLEADPRHKGPARRRKLTFLFVDEHGLGQYTQRYSTE